MGASESAARPSNRTQEEEERERQQQQQKMSSTGAAAGVAVGAAVAAVGAAVAAWGISRMLSGNAETEEKHEEAMMLNRNVSVIMKSYVPPRRRPNSTSTHGQESYPTTTHVWSPPLPGCFKMNTDAGCRPNQGTRGGIYQDGMHGPSGCGGILRNHLGKCVRGFQEFIGTSDCLTAEFKGILKGLRILDKLGLQGSILESDSDAAIRWIKQVNSPYRLKSQVISAIWEDIKECKRLIKKNRIIISRCCREANKCADKLADMAIDKRAGYMEFTSANVPAKIMQIVDKESDQKI